MSDVDLCEFKFAVVCEQLLFRHTNHVPPRVHTRGARFSAMCFTCETLPALTVAALPPRETEERIGIWHSWKPKHSMRADCLLSCDGQLPDQKIDQFVDFLELFQLLFRKSRCYNFCLTLNLICWFCVRSHSYLPPDFCLLLALCLFRACGLFRLSFGP